MHKYDIKTVFLSQNLKQIYFLSPLERFKNLIYVAKISF